MSFSRRWPISVDFNANSLSENEAKARIIVPANRDLEIFNLRAAIGTSANTDGVTAASLELVNSQGGALASVSVSGRAGDVLEASETASAPVRLEVSGGAYGGDTFLILRQKEGDVSSFKGTVQIDMTYPGAK